MYIKERPNYHTYSEPTIEKISTPSSPMKSKTEIGFGLPYAVYLLFTVLAVIVSPSFITNRTDGYEMVNICSLVGLHQ